MSQVQRLGVCHAAFEGGSNDGSSQIGQEGSSNGENSRAEMKKQKESGMLLV